jgi:hypothetical protein
MAIRADELRAWLNMFKGEDLLGIDQGGLSLVLVNEQSIKDDESDGDTPYIEIGGIP